MTSAMEDLTQDSESTPYSDLCKICLRTRSKYVCPRCNTPYCSLNCYRSELHLDCSESFYQEWVENELKCNKVSLEGQRRMLEILQRIQTDGNDEELDSDDEDSRPDLADRLDGIDLNDTEQVWEKLSAQEKAAFQELVNSGDAANLIQPWDPWWTKRFEEPKVTSADSVVSKQKELDSHKQICPPIIKKIKPFNEITKSKPSSSVIYDLTNILGSYAIVVKYFNGDHWDFPEEAAAIIYQISQSLSSSQMFSSFEMALEAVGLKALINDGLDTGENEIETMKRDVGLIMNGPSNSDPKFYILAALSDIQNIFSSKNKKNQKGKFNEMFKMSNTNVTLNKNASKLCIKRIDFFLSLTVSIDFNVFMKK